MDVETITKEMDSLEQRWFAADRVAAAAHRQLTNKSSVEMWTAILCGVLGGMVAASLSRVVITSEQEVARVRLEVAGRRKQEIMREIEALEDSLVAENRSAAASEVATPSEVPAPSRGRRR